ncbi:MAG TPA: transglutaminase family protein [Dehalococcoidales bacterium]
MEDWRQYYATQSMITDPAKYGPFFNALPSDIPALCRSVQGLILHGHWAERYGVKLSEERRQEANLRKVSRQLGRIMELNDSPLTTTRPLESRIVGNCRDFSVFLTAVLRHKGVPARARCGFGTYFIPHHYEDHWVCQYWEANEERWVMVDAQLDEFQRNWLNIGFDTFDMPEGHFLPAGRAWQLSRSGQADPESFGILDCHGMWFIGGNVVRDLLSLNKIELLPWDMWGLMPGEKVQDIPVEQAGLLDRIASVTLAGNEAFTEILSIGDKAKLSPLPGWKP